MLKTKPFGSNRQGKGGREGKEAGGQQEPRKWRGRRGELEQRQRNPEMGEGEQGRKETATPHYIWAVKAGKLA